MSEESIVIYASGEVRTITAPTELPEYQQLQYLTNIMGCQNIEVKRLPDSLALVLDEDGRNTRDLNILATLVARKLGSHSPQGYFGTVVIMRVDQQGRTLNLTEGDAKKVQAVIGEINKGMDTLNQMGGPD
jgi:hypothetical protein